jgi:hypothetical protein
MQEARLSPDGRWIAYVSNESGQEEVYVRRFPDLDRKWQVSRQGGTTPHWRRDGREIVFLAAGVRVLAVAVDPREDELNPGVPQLLFETARALQGFSPAPDHERFLAASVPSGRTEPPMRLVMDWAGEFSASR